jgi:hypothetical protein
LRVKRPGLDADHPPRPSAKVKNGYIHPLPPSPLWRGA